MTTFSPNKLFTCLLFAALLSACVGQAPQDFDDADGEAPQDDSTDDPNGAAEEDPADDSDQPASVAEPCTRAEFEQRMGALPRVKNFRKVACGTGVQDANALCYSLLFEQPISHTSLTGPKFGQRVEIVHRGCDWPTVLADWGYDWSGHMDTELSVDYGANMINMEHRYQGESVPTSTQWDWKALTIKNGAADQHDIITTLREVYAANWVVTGASKGGITSLYHRYFYPDDVQGTVAYVAPASRSRIDRGYQTWMQQTLPATCLRKLQDYQVAAITTRKTYMEGQAGGRDNLLYRVLYLDWSLFQYNDLDFCATIPTAASSNTQFYAFLSRWSDASSWVPPATDGRSDDALSYEWLTEHGFSEQLNDKMRTALGGPVQTMESGFRAAYPNVNLPSYNGSITTQVRDWVANEAQDVMLVYGATDPWTGGELAEPQQASSHRFYAKDKGHGAQIAHLSSSDQTVAHASLRRMMGVPRSTLRSARLGVARANQTLADYLQRHVAYHHTAWLRRAAP